MFNILKNNLKHFFITFTTLFLMLAFFEIYHGAEAQDRIAFKLDKEVPDIFFEHGTVVVNYVRGSKQKGFYNDKATYPLDSESGYKTFRDFLIENGVIDESLSWPFDKNHIVFVGKLVDRKNSVTQALRFIYKVEQGANNHGENVHFIIDNHEIKNLPTNYYETSRKSLYIASTIKKTQSNLYGENSFLGQWLTNKNSVKRLMADYFFMVPFIPKLVNLIIH